MSGKRRSRATHAAVAALYFADASDYRNALAAVVRILEPALADLLQRDAALAYQRACELAGEPHDAASPAPHTEETTPHE